MKNVERIELGRFEMETWYFSPFPPEYKDVKARSPGGLCEQRVCARSVSADWAAAPALTPALCAEAVRVRVHAQLLQNTRAAAAPRAQGAPAPAARR